MFIHAYKDGSIQSPVTIKIAIGLFIKFFISILKILNTFFIYFTYSSASAIPESLNFLSNLLTIGCSGSFK